VKHNFQHWVAIHVLGSVVLQEPPLLEPDVDILSPDKVGKLHTALTLQIMLIAPYVCWITPFLIEQTYIVCSGLLTMQQGISMKFS
jgi:hypothetical protein